jgi:hypothetical protein
MRDAKVLAHHRATSALRLGRSVEQGRPACAGRQDGPSREARRGSQRALSAGACGIGQGHIFAQALPLDRLIAMLKELAKKIAPSS